MSAFAATAQALGIAYAAGINLYATVAVIGLAERLGWIGPLPGQLGGVDSWFVIAVAGGLYAVEFLVTLIPGLASIWEAIHSFIRPPAAALLAAGAVAGSDPGVPLIAGLLGGGLALGTHGTKLGLRMAVDTSPEPVTNGLANLSELGVVVGLLAILDHHPVLGLALALGLLVAMVLLVRTIWRRLRHVVSRWRRGSRAPAAAAQRTALARDEAGRGPP